MLNKLKNELSRASFDYDSQKYYNAGIKFAIHELERVIADLEGESGDMPLTRRSGLLRAIEVLKNG
jgi:hypothetical protein